MQRMRPEFSGDLWVGCSLPSPQLTHPSSSASLVGDVWLEEGLATLGTVLSSDDVLLY